jgi:RNA polymerase sigma factor (sigma-70 family)
MIFRQYGGAARVLNFRMKENVISPPRTGDAALLEEFRSRRSEAAFDEIVARHGTLVFRTCARILRDTHAAEDATQGVFLALARQPEGVRGSLPGWLYEVSRRTSFKLLRSTRRRTAREREASTMTRPNDAVWRSELDAALASLPAQLREAIVLRYLEGRSQTEAARAAGCPQGTLGWRAMEGLNRLRTLLSRRGAVLTSAALVALLAQEAQAAVPPALAETLKLSTLAAGGGGAAAVAQGVVKGLIWLKIKLSALAAALVAAVALPLALSSVPPAAPPAPPQARAEPATDYNISLLTDSAPDFTDIDAYLRSITSQHSTPQEKAIAVWRWSQRLRKQTSYPTEDGHEVLDPIQMFTSYGYTMCGIISGVDNSLWLKLGWKAHYVQLGDHTVCECSWDGGRTWHMFDNSMSIYCFNDKGEVAGTREIEKNPRFYLENFAPECGTNPVKGLKDHQGWRNASDHPVENERTLANGMDSFLPPNDVIEDHLAARWGRGYAITLRPGESYTRHFTNLDAGKADPHYYRPLHGKDPDKGGHRANGIWVYAPDLAKHPDLYAESGVTWTPQGVQGPGSVTFKVDAANVVTSARLTLKGSGASASTSRDAGITWAKVDGEPDVAGTTQYLVKVDLLGAGSRLESFSAETITQINRPAMPGLVRGANRVQLRLGPQVETLQFQPSLVQGNHRKSAFEETSVEVNEKPYFNVSTLRPSAKGAASVTWKFETPTPILDAVYGGNVTVKAGGDRTSLLHSWDGKTYREDFRKADGALPYDLMVLASAGQAPPDQNRIFLRYEFETPSPTEKWRAPGIQTALLTVHHRPRRTGFSPIEVTYDWIEHREDGDVERSHTEIVTSPEHEYSIHVAGYRDPTMKSVRMCLAHGAKPGYSDGKDVGPGAAPVRAIYAWGSNLAKGKPYTLEGKQSDKNPDAGGDLTDGIVAPPEEYVSVKWMPTNVIFQQDVSPVATIDLGREETVAAVRVHAGQEPGFHLAFPDAITVEVSSDGRTFARAGQALHHQVFDPPADHADWELKDSPRYASLPAGGRLAYGYRIVFEKPVAARYVRVSCAARKGWGVMLSEIQVFDRVTVNTKVPPSVVLPPLSRPH